MAAQLRIILQLQREFDGSDQSGSGHVPEGVLGHVNDVHHEGNTAARPHINSCAAAGHAGECVFDGLGQLDWVFGHTGPQRPTRTAHEKNRAQRWFTILFDPKNRFGKRFRQLRLDRAEIFV